jgi:hypothetical protein
MFALLVAHCFVSVFEMTIDTIFLCYCEDVDENDGSAARPYYMSADLKQVMDDMKEIYGNKMKFQSLNDKNVDVSVGMENTPPTINV